MAKIVHCDFCENSAPTLQAVMLGFLTLEVSLKYDGKDQIGMVMDVCKGCGEEFITGKSFAAVTKQKIR